MPRRETRRTPRTSREAPQPRVQGRRDSALGPRPARLDVLTLQRTAGNSAVVHLLRDRAPFVPPVVQAKVMVGAANDPLEREADRIADQVLRSWPAASAAEQEEPGVRRVPEPTGDLRSSFQADDSAALRLSARQGSGNALPPAVRGRMEAGFGADFGAVRIHRDAEAADLSAGLAARAFTHGADIYFGHGAYDPGTRSGQHLLAHELAHVVQQGRAGLRRRSVRRVPVPAGTIQRRFSVPRGGTKHQNVGGGGSSAQVIFDDARVSRTSIPDYDVMDRHISVFPRQDGTADDFHVTFELLPNSGVEGSAHQARSDYEKKRAEQDAAANWRGGPRPPSSAGKVSIHFFYDERRYLRSDIDRKLPTTTLSDQDYKEAWHILKEWADDIAWDFAKQLKTA